MSVLLPKLFLAGSFGSCRHFILLLSMFMFHNKGKALRLRYRLLPFILSSFDAFLGCCEVKIPDQSHEVGEENPVLDGHEVDVDNLRHCPDLPVCKQGAQELVAVIKTLCWNLTL